MDTYCAFGKDEACNEIPHELWLDGIVILPSGHQKHRAILLSSDPHYSQFPTGRHDTLVLDPARFAYTCTIGAYNRDRRASWLMQ